MNFFKNYFITLKNGFLSNVVFWSIITFLYVLAPFSFSFLDWYGDKVQGNIVKKDPIAYPHKYKQKTYYSYYADVYFPDENITKRTSISAQTHAHGLQGQAYIFKRNHVLQTGKRNTLMFASIVNLSICFVIFMALLFNFCVLFENHFFKKKEK